MKASKAAALLLIGQCFLASSLGNLVMAQTKQFTLTGQVTVKQGQRLTARLYFPKDTGKKPLLAFVDGNGYFEFDQVAVGSYLVEIYAGSDLLYQKSIDLNAGFRVDDPIVRLVIKSAESSWTKVADNTRLEQRHKATLNGNEFQGNVSVYVGDIHGSRSFSVIVFKTGRETSGWQDSKQIEERTLRGALARGQVLSDARISRSKKKTSFTYNGRYYSLDVTEFDGNSKTDFLNFEIYRKN